jgi:hypothetical protein
MVMCSGKFAERGHLMASYWDWSGGSFDAKQ